MVVIAAIAMAVAAVARVVYPTWLSRRTRRPIGDDGIVVGAATIDLPKAKAPAVLLLHGAGDTPQVLSGLASHLSKNGFAIRAPLMPGHGRSMSEFARVTADDWFGEAASQLDALRQQHEWVAVLGLSMGGALAIRLAAEHPDIPALVLLAPYVAVPRYMQRLAETARWWGWLFPYFSSRGAQSIHDPEAKRQALGYGVFTPSAIVALATVVRKATDSLHRVSCPTLVVQSREDNRIPVAVAEDAFARIASSQKELIWVEHAGHVITVDYGHKAVFEIVTHWIQTQLRVSQERHASA